MINSIEIGFMVLFVVVCFLTLFYYEWSTDRFITMFGGWKRFRKGCVIQVLFKIDGDVWYKLDEWRILAANNEYMWLSDMEGNHQFPMTYRELIDKNVVYPHKKVLLVDECDYPIRWYY